MAIHASINFFSLRGSYSRYSSYTRAYSICRQTWILTYYFGFFVRWVGGGEWVINYTTAQKEHFFTGKREKKKQRRIITSNKILITEHDRICIWMRAGGAPGTGGRVWDLIYEGVRIKCHGKMNGARYSPRTNDNNKAKTMKKSNGREINN